VGAAAGASVRVLAIVFIVFVRIKLSFCRQQ